MPARKQQKRLSNRQTRKSVKNPLTPKSPKAINSNDELPLASLNSHCRQLFVGYYLGKSEGVFDQMYVDTHNNAFLVPETPMLDFQRIFLLNQWFNQAVRAYFRYIHFHYSITSRSSNEFEFKKAHRMFSESLDNLPSLELTKHNSIVVFENGSLLHVFKTRNFMQLRQQGLFREKAFSLTFYGSDTTQVPIKSGLFTDLKELNFQTSEDMSGTFKRLLEDSFISLKQLTFYHRAFMSRLNDQVIFPPNLQHLCSTSNFSTILDCNVRSHQKLLNIGTQQLTIGIELLNRLMDRLDDAPIFINPQIQQLKIHWSSSLHGVDIVELINHLIPNTPHLQSICFRKREVVDLYGAWNQYEGQKQDYIQNYLANCLCEIDLIVRLFVQSIKEVCDRNRISTNYFPFEVIFELRLFVFYRRSGNRVPFSKHPIDVQFVLQKGTAMKMRMLENNRQVVNDADIKIDDNLKSTICQTMMEFWAESDVKKAPVLVVTGKTSRRRVNTNEI